MYKHILTKLTLEENEVLITSFEHCLKQYFLLKEGGFTEKDLFNENKKFNETEFLKDIREQIDNASLYEYDLLLLMYGKVDVFVYKIDRENKTFNIFSHRVG